MVKKISLLVHRLDIPTYTKIHSVISVAHLSRYRTHEDPYHCVPPPPGPVESSPRSDTEASTDGTRDNKHWELKRIVEHRTKRGKTEYLVRWKGYGPQDDSWKKAAELIRVKELVEEYYEHRRRVKGLGGETTAEAWHKETVTHGDAPT
jgi:hypothetical protein